MVCIRKQLNTRAFADCGFVLPAAALLRKSNSRPYVLEMNNLPGAELTADDTPGDDEVVGAIQLRSDLSVDVIAKAMAWRNAGCIVVDHRRAFATAQRFPNTKIIGLRAAEGLRYLKLDSRTAVVALTHNPDLDDAGLIEALASPAFYVAALGSRRTQSQRLERLRRLEVEESSLCRLFGPSRHCHWGIQSNGNQYFHHGSDDPGAARGNKRWGS